MREGGACPLQRDKEKQWQFNWRQNISKAF